MRILIVEDDAVTRKLLGKLLEGVGECVQALNGKQALEIYQNAVETNHKFELICLDILLPGSLTGIDILEQIRKLEHNNGVLVGEGSKILMISSVSDDLTRLKALMKLSDGYLTKPINKIKLMKKLQEIEILS